MGTFVVGIELDTGKGAYSYTHKILRIMKKFIVALAVLLASVSLAFAQQNTTTGPSLSTAAKLAFNWLQNEGYRPYVDSDGDVAFKVEGYNYYVISYTDDDNYLSLLLPGIITIGDGEYAAGIIAANKICREKKVVKAYLGKNDDVVNLSIEMFLDNSPEVGNIMERSIRMLKSAKNAIVEEFNNLL